MAVVQPFNVLKIINNFFLFKAHQLLYKGIMGYMLCNSCFEERKILNNNVPNTKSEILINIIVNTKGSRINQ